MTCKCSVCVSEYLAKKLVYDAALYKTGLEEPSLDQIKDGITHGSIMAGENYGWTGLRGMRHTTCVP
jgi:hypothetical protein